MILRDMGRRLKGNKWLLSQKQQVKNTFCGYRQY